MPAMSSCRSLSDTEFRAGGHGKRLEEALRSGGIEAEALVALLEQMRGAFDTFGACAAAFHIGSGQRFDGVEVASGVGFAEGGSLRGRLGGGSGGEGKRQQEGQSA